jgi:plastocyanin
MIRFSMAVAFASAAAVSTGADAVAAPPQQIQIYSYGYAPAPVLLAADQPVTLQFINRSGKSHEFSAPAFFAASRILAGSIHNGEIDLRGGESASVTLVPARGTYKVHCGHPFHSMLGMHTMLVVR